jgi:DNA-binding transcriptional MerR regulator
MSTAVSLKQDDLVDFIKMFRDQGLKWEEIGEEIDKLGFRGKIGKKIHIAELNHELLTRYPGYRKNKRRVDPVTISVNKGKKKSANGPARNPADYLAAVQTIMDLPISRRQKMDAIKRLT